MTGWHLLERAAGTVPPNNVSSDYTRDYKPLASIVTSISVFSPYVPTISNTTPSSNELCSNILSTRFSRQTNQ